MHHIAIGIFNFIISFSSVCSKYRYLHRQIAGFTSPSNISAVVKPKMCATFTRNWSFQHFCFFFSIFWYDGDHLIRVCFQFVFQCVLNLCKKLLEKEISHFNLAQRIKNSFVFLFAAGETLESEVFVLDSVVQPIKSSISTGWRCQTHYLPIESYEAENRNNCHISNMDHTNQIGSASEFIPSEFYFIPKECVILNYWINEKKKYNFLIFFPQIDCIWLYLKMNWFHWTRMQYTIFLLMKSWCMRVFSMILAHWIFACCIVIVKNWIENWPQISIQRRKSSTTQRSIHKSGWIRHS